MLLPLIKIVNPRQTVLDSFLWIKSNLAGTKVSCLLSLNQLIIPVQCDVTLAQELALRFCISLDIYTLCNAKDK